MVEQDHDFKFIKSGEIRTRFAPSPTGPFHIGSARTALFNCLFTRKYQGRFILRIEDTDKERSKLEYEKDIISNLKWLGIEWDEGPDIGGNYAPYRQSRRIEIYEAHLKKLLDKNLAYHCFCSEEDIAAERQYLMSIGKPPIYSGKCANLPKEVAEKRLADGEKSIIRFRTPAKKIIVKDLIRGAIEFDTALLGDFSIARDLASPLYNFACVVDDFEMKISHVLRGEDHISNTPKQVLLQEALELPNPQYAHLPLILAPDRTKLSKRHGTVSMAEFRKQGYLSEALVNFISFLGWNPGTEREIYSLLSLIKEFSLERVKKGGAVFNIKRLDYLNAFYIRQKSAEKLTEDCIPYLVRNGLIKEKATEESSTDRKEFPVKRPDFIVSETNEIIDFEKIEGIVVLYKERMKKLSDICSLTSFFFKKDLRYKKDLLKWKDQKAGEVVNALDKIEEMLSKMEGKNWNKGNLQRILSEKASEFSQGLSRKGDRGYLLWPLRVAMTGERASAGPFEIAELLGKEKALARIKQAKEKFN